MRDWGGRFALRVGASILCLFFALLLLIGFFDVHAPIGKDVALGLDAYGMPRAPSWAYPFGTDMLGRCLASRLAAGAWVSLTIASVATCLVVALGSILGFLAGYVGGRLDSMLMRAVEIILSFPLLLVGVGIAASLRGRAVGIGPALAVLVFVGFPPVTRFVRARVRALRLEGYVEASRALGGSHAWIVARHLLPGLFGQFWILVALTFPQMLLAESTLSFLGLGEPEPMPAWGRMLSDGQTYLRSAPWMTFVPSAAILVVALGFGLVAEGSRRRLMVEGRR